MTNVKPSLSFAKRKHFASDKPIPFGVRTLCGKDGTLVTDGIYRSYYGRTFQVTKVARLTTCTACQQKIIRLAIDAKPETVYP